MNITSQLHQAPSYAAYNIIAATVTTIVGAVALITTAALKIFRPQQKPPAPPPVPLLEVLELDDIRDQQRAGG